DLVGVSRADAALRCADLAVAEGCLAGCIEFLVQRQHDVRAVRNQELFRRDGDALAFDSLDLSNEADRIDDDAIAYDVDLAVPEDAGGEQVQDVLRATGDDRVAGVVAALAA